MKGIVCTIAIFAILAAFGLLPFENHDAAELTPVETLAANFDTSGVTLTGDGGQHGAGATWEQAVADLKNSTKGVAFLQTAKKIVLSGNLSEALQTVAQADELRPAAELFQIDVAGDVKALGEYLQTRNSPVTLQELQAALLSGENTQLPRLKSDGETVRQDE